MRIKESHIERLIKEAVDATVGAGTQGAAQGSTGTLAESRKIRLTESDIRNMVKQAVNEVLDTFGLARDAYKASCDRGDWGTKPDFPKKLYQRMGVLAPQNFDPNLDVIVVGGDGEGEYKAGELEQYFDVTGYVEPSPNPRYNDTKLIGAPTIKGYLGPMLDGDRLRYETQEVYDLLSM